MVENDGKDLEHLVRLVEQSITPGSTVEHNVNLPVIGSESGLTRQCDVIIRLGPQARETITIVEVQDRIARTEIGEFEGWLGKLKDVGAQHLICVSRHEFPISIKEGAIKAGNTVKLITLKEIPAESLPINISFKNKCFDLKKCEARIAVSRKEVEELGIKDAVTEKLMGRTEQDPKEKCLSFDKSELFCLLDLCKDNRPEDVSEGDGKLVFNKEEGPDLYMLLEDKFFRVGLECNFSWSYTETEKPVTVLTYEQNVDGILAWVAEIYNDGGYVKFPIVEDEGNYRIDGMLVKLPAGTTLTFKVLKNDDGQID